MRAAILHAEIADPAPRDEQDSLVQLAAVSQALTDLGFEPTPVPFSLDVRTTIHALQNLAPDIVFNLVESVEGKGRLIHMAPTVLDHLKLPYTGSATEAVFLTSNKLLAKGLLRSSGIPTPDWLSLDSVSPQSSLPDRDYIVKSVWEHASVGLDGDSVVASAHSPQLRQLIKERQDQDGGPFFAEAYIDGREFSISLLAHESGAEVLPPAEMRFLRYPAGKSKILDYRAKWDEDSFEYRHTTRSFDFGDRDSNLIRSLSDLAQRCWCLFGLRGYARVDFRVDGAGNPWMLEVNVNPCLSPDSGFVAAAHRTGLSFAGTVERIINASAKQQ